MAAFGLACWSICEKSRDVSPWAMRDAMVAILAGLAWRTGLDLRRRNRIVMSWRKINASRPWAIRTIIEFIQRERPRTIWIVLEATSRTP
jgi:hypothetical protein